MAKLTLWVPKLTANKDSRTLSGRLLPFNEPGFTNLGKIIASADSKIDVAPDVIFNVEHDAKAPIGRAVTLTAAADGIDSVFSVLPTRAGDDALTEADAGLRCGLSVEMEPVVIRAGKLISGTITGAAQVVRPAFDSARLVAEDAPVVPDMGEEPTDKTDVTLPEVDINGEKLENVTDVTVTETKIDIKTDAPAPADAETKDETMAAGNATVTNPALTASGAKKKVLDKNKLFAAFTAFNVTPGARLEAALTDITTVDVLGIEQPQYVGQLWQDSPYERVVIPMFNHADLTSMKIAGWRFKDGKKPTVAKYTGDKAAIPSNAVQTEPVSEDAYRIAGGWDIDRKFRDFSNNEFWEALFAAATESYKIQSDGYALEDILAAATVVTPGTVPSGVDPAMAAIVDGVVAILDETRTIADGALVAPNLWRNMVLTRAEDVLPYLNAMLGFDEGTVKNFTIKPCADLEASQVLVKVKSAATVHELPGEAPIRVEALDVAKGGIDEAVFGYQAVNIHNAKGLALVEVE